MPTWEGRGAGVDGPEAQNSLVMWEYLSCSGRLPILSLQGCPKFSRVIYMDSLYDFHAPSILNTTKLTAWRANRGSTDCSHSTGITDLRMQWVSRRKFPLGFPKQSQSKVLG